MRRTADTAHCRQLGVEPDLILGDFDSLDEENRRHVEVLRREQPDRVRVFPVIKDDTDMLAAVKEGLKRGFVSFDLYAAAGESAFPTPSLTFSA